MLSLSIFKRQKYNEEISTQKELLSDINYIKNRLKSVQDSFNLISDEDLIEANIYEEISLRARYDYLIKKAKNADLL